MSSEPSRPGQKRARPPSESAGQFYALMRDFSVQLAAVQKQMQEHAPDMLGGVTLPDTVQRSAWTQLLQLRPFLFLCFSSKQTDTTDLTSVASSLGGHGVSGEQRRMELQPIFRDTDIARNYRHVSKALRLYSIACRLSESVPLAALHSCLTLLSVLPRLASPDPALAENTSRCLSSIHGCLLSLYQRDREIFFSLLAAITSEDGLGVFLSIPQLGGSGGTRARTVRILPEKERLQILSRLLVSSESASSCEQNAAVRASMTDETVKMFFRSTVEVRSVSEAVNMAYGLWSVLERLCREPAGVLQPQEMDVQYFVGQACKLLSTRLESFSDTNPPSPSYSVASPLSPATPSDRTAANSAATLQSAGQSSTPTSTEDLTRAIHGVTGQLLATLAEKGFLLADVVGPLLFSMTTGYLAYQVNLRTATPQKPPEWLYRLLHWLWICATGTGRSPTSWLSAALFHLDVHAFGKALRLCTVLFHHVISVEENAVANEDQPVASFYSVHACVSLASMLQVGVAQQVDGAAAEQQLLLDDNFVCGLHGAISLLLSAPLPSRLWRLNAVSCGPLTTPCSASRCSRVVFSPLQVASLAQTLLGLYPSAALQPMLQSVQESAEVCQSAGRRCLVRANGFVACRAVRTGMAGRECHPGSGALSCRETTVSRPEESACTSLLAEVLEALVSCVDGDLPTILQAFTVLFLFVAPPVDTRAHENEKKAQKGTALSSSPARSSRTTEGTLPTTAVAVLRAVEEYGVEHRAAFNAVDHSLWSIFLYSLTRHLPFSANESQAVFHALRRACLVPKRSRSEMVVYAARLGGFARGVRWRLSRLHVHALCSRSADVDSLSAVLSDGAGATGHVSHADSAGDESLGSMGAVMQEAHLVFRGALAALQFLVQEKTSADWALVVDDPSVVFMVFEVALLQRCVANGQAAGCTHELNASKRDALAPANSSEVVRGQEEVVDVDDDDDDGGGEEDANDRAASAADASTSKEKDGLLAEENEENSCEEDVPSGANITSGATSEDDVLHARILSAIVNLVVQSEKRASSSTVVEESPFVSAGLRLLCTSLVLSPRSRDGDQLLYTRIVCHDSCVLRCGYGSVAVMALLTSRSDFSFLANARDAVAGAATTEQDYFQWPGAVSAAEGTKQGCGDLHQVSPVLYKLEAIAAAFSVTGHNYLEGTDLSHIDDAYAIDVARRCQSICRQHSDGAVATVTAEGSRFLRVCCGLWEDSRFPAVGRATLMDAAKSVLLAIDWSPEDLCRRHPEAAGTGFFADLCVQCDVDTSEVIQRSLDVLLTADAVAADVTDSGTSASEGAGDSVMPAALERRETHFMPHLLRSLLSNNGGLVRVFAPAVANILYTAPTNAVKAALFNKILGRLDLKVDNVTRYVKNTLPSIVLCLVSLQADAELRCFMNQQRHPGTTITKDSAVPGTSSTRTSTNCVTRGRGVHSPGAEGPAASHKTSVPDATCFSIFSLAVRQAVSLSECQGTDAAIERAFTAPFSIEETRTALVYSLFDVIDSIGCRLALHSARSSGTAGSSPEGGISRADGCASVTGARRWLLGLCSFVSFLGPESTRVASKLPSLLEASCSVRALLQCTCHVWLTLVRACREQHLEGHAPALVVDLVSIDYLHKELEPSTFALLLDSVRWLYAKTGTQAFWQSYFAVIGPSSRLLQALSYEIAKGKDDSTPARKPTRSRRTSPRARRHTQGTPSTLMPGEDAAAAEERREKVAAIIEGFLTVMQSSNAKCKSVFVRALHRFLASADMAFRLEMGYAAAANAEVIPTLLQCARMLKSAEDVQSAFQCVGIIGAVAPTSIVTQPANDTVSRVGGSSQAAYAAKQQTYFLSVPLILDWRQMAFRLLSDFCPRALSNTADPGMHDRAAYAVQELLRVYTKKERRESNGIELGDNEILHVEELQRYTWWASLADNTKQMLSAFTTTRYTTRIMQTTERRTPEYHAGMPYQQWVFAFFRNLAFRCVGSFGDTLMSLRNVAKRDGALLLFLLHLAMVHVLDNEDDSVWDDIVKEYAAVFEAAAAAVPVGIGGSPSSGSARVSAAVNCKRTTQLSSGSNGGEPRMSIRSDSAMEVRPDPESQDRKGSRSLDEHVQCLLHLVEDMQHLRWMLVRVARDGVLNDEDDRMSSGSSPVAYGEAERQNCLRFAEFLESFLLRLQWSKRTSAAIDIGSHVRALRCIESQSQLPKVSEAIAAVPLQRIFAALSDRDSARSIHRLSLGLDPDDAAFSLENTGEWQLALQHCELVLQHNPSSVPHQLTSLRCMRQLGQLHLMSRYAEALLSEVQQHTGHARDLHRSEPALLAAAPPSSKWPSVEEWSAGILQNYANEAAWRLGEWERVRPDMTLPVSLAVPVTTLMAHILPQHDAAADGASLKPAQGHGGGGPASTWATVAHAAAAERAKLSSLLRSASREGYAQAYPYVSMLHALADVELVAEMCSTQGKGSCSPEHDRSALLLPPTALSTGLEVSSNVLANVVVVLNRRLELVENTLEAREPLLSLHRSIYRALGLRKEVSDTWIGHAQLLKDSNFPEAALSAARQSNFDCPAEESNTSFFTMTADLLHGMNTTMQAIEFAQAHAVNTSLPAAVRANLQISVTNWTLEIGSQTPEEVVKSYLKAIQLDDSSEHAHHSLALFYDKLYSLRSEQLEMRRLTLSDTDNVGQQRIMTELVSAIETYALKAVDHFGRALLRGLETVSISLPRLLTLWLDLTSTLHAMARARVISADRHSIRNFNDLVTGFMLNQDINKRIPARVLMTNLTQLLSRLGHECQAVVDCITRIVVHLTKLFPQQCLWHVLSITFSSVERRRRIAEESIIKPYIQSSPAAAALFSTANKLFVALIAFCERRHEDFQDRGSNRVAPLSSFPFMQEITKTLRNTTFLVPTVSNLTPDIYADTDEEVFAATPTIAGFRDQVAVLKSQQHPKRIFVVTHQGDDVSFLCKANDEPRKDIRTMELAFLMNVIFLKNPDARRKQFSLLRYCVAALKDDCALIEWVSHLASLRDVAAESYRYAGVGASFGQVKKWEEERSRGGFTRQHMMEALILPCTPPVLHQWFDRSFKSNHEWYQARTLYTQSTALWSMVGHIIGLGDRHCENLSLCQFTGEMMHVDFAALFDYGETLQVPERVRFRLTQNIVDAMGVLGADGPFRANCEIALHCQQDNKKAVMSIVETLVHDPLLEWTKCSQRAAKVTPKQRMERVARRLDGYLDLYEQPADTLALNVAGQVTKLINHSSAPENLDEMYTWWMPWV